MLMKNFIPNVGKPATKYWGGDQWQNTGLSSSRNKKKGIWKYEVNVPEAAEGAKAKSDCIKQN